MISTYNAQGSTMYMWSFPGGTPSFASGYGLDTIDSVFYNTPGAYTVCLTIHDTVASCSDSLCDSVIVTGTSALSGTAFATNASCGNCNGNALANATGGVPPYTYLWSTAATSQGITGLCAGNYSVTITDANLDTVHVTTSVASIGGVSVNLGPDINACTGDSVQLDATINLGGPYTYSWNTGETTASIGVTNTMVYACTVTDSSGCSGIDSVLVTFNNGPSVTLTGTDETCTSCCDGTVNASVGTGPYFYSWSNSAGNVSSQTGLCPGTYTVTVEDTLTGCQTVESTTVNAYTASCYTMAGEITQGANTRVYLIQEVNAVLTAVDSTTTDSTGLFVFYNVCNGTYYVKGALLPAHAAYSTTIPTYYDSAALWSSATALAVNNAAIYGVDFTLLSGTNNGGAGFIGGLISQGANRDEGDPVVGAYVAAYNEDGSLAGFARSDANGEYAIDNLSLGTYEVYVDVLNKTAYPHVVALTDEITTSDNRDFEVVGDVIKPIELVGIADNVSSKFEVYPNPTDGRLHINTSGLAIDNISVFSILGERVVTFTPTQQGGVINLDLSELAPGTYVLEVNGDNTPFHQTIIVE
ncbi:MAG: hypothetical protein Salg2KO_15680 [Salibacteraceae bacterium]